MNEKDFSRLKAESPLGMLPEDELANIFEIYLNYNNGKITKEELTNLLWVNGVSVDKFVTFYEQDRKTKITVKKAKELESGVFSPDDVRYIVVSVPKYGVIEANMFLDRFALEVLAKNGNEKAISVVSGIEKWEKNHSHLSNNEDRSL